MACPAIVGVREFAMHRSLRVDLFADVRMAGDASARHGFAAPRRSMAGGAMAAQFRMGANAADLRFGFGFTVERAGAEHAAAPDGQYGDRQSKREKCDGSSGTKESNHGPFLHRMKVEK